MGHATRAGAFQTFSIAVAAGAAVLTVLLVAPAVAAPGKGAELLASGVKSLEAGKPADAVTTLTSALSSGSLDSAGMAKALYYRGLAQRRQGRPAQAIADLTNAMWIKGGLTEAERADATTQRAAAYQEAGVAGAGTAKVATAAPPVPAASAPVASSAPVPSTGWQTSSEPARAVRPSPVVAAAPDEQAAASGYSAPAVGSFFSNLFSGGSQSKADSAAQPVDVAAPVAIPPPRPVAAVPPVPAATVPPPAPARQPAAATPASWQTATAPAADSARAAPAAAAPPPPAPAPAATGSSTSTVAGLFSNLFSGGSQSTAPTEPSASGLTTSSTGAPTTAVSSWSGTTTSAPAKVQPAVQPVRTAAAAPPTSPAAAPAARANPPASRQVQVQVASVRSRDAAASVADRLRKEHGFRLDAREPVIEEKVYGNMGTFYTVKIGPYPDQTEPGKLCQTLRPSGFDCLVLTE